MDLLPVVELSPGKVEAGLEATAALEAAVALEATVLEAAVVLEAAGALEEVEVAPGPAQAPAPAATAASSTAAEVYCPAANNPSSRFYRTSNRQAATAAGVREKPEIEIQARRPG